MKKISNNIGGDEIGIIVFFIIITLGLIVLYWYKNKDKDQSAAANLKTLGNAIVNTVKSSTASTGSGTATSGPTGNLKVSGEQISEIQRRANAQTEANCTLTDIKSTESKYITTFNPHYKGVWIDKGGIIRERFSGRSFVKDEDIELYSKNLKCRHYLAKYKGETCYFPISLIREDGFYQAKTI